MITSTPTKPAEIASQRRQPTASPRNSAAPSVTASGNAWKIAAVLASGKCTIAVRKAIVPATSAATRNAIGLTIAELSLRTLDCRKKSAAISSIAKMPRTSITWPKFISDDTALVIASFIVKLAMPTTMNRLPRMLEWACKSISEEENVHRMRFGGHQKCEGAIPKGIAPLLKSHRAGLLCVFPGGLRQRHRALGRLDGLGVGGGAVADAPGDTLGDAGEAEQIVGEIPVEVGHGHAGKVTIDLRRLCLARNVQRLEIDIGKTRHGPLHEEVSEVGHGIAERRQFPIQHRQHARFRRMEDHVVEAVVAVNDRDALLRRHCLGQPFGELLEFRDVLGFGGAVLLGPAVDLAGEII